MFTSLGVMVAVLSVLLLSCDVCGVDAGVCCGGVVVFDDVVGVAGVVVAGGDGVGVVDAGGHDVVVCVDVLLHVI